MMANKASGLKAQSLSIFKAKPVALSPVEEIKRLHGEIQCAGTLDKAIRIGELLIAQKLKSGHGNWIPWLEKNVPFAERTAQVYMRCFERRDDIKSKSAESALLNCTVEGALKLLTDRKLTAEKPAKVLTVKTSEAQPKSNNGDSNPDRYKARLKKAMIAYVEQQCAFAPSPRNMGMGCVALIDKVN